MGKFSDDVPFSSDRPTATGILVIDVGGTHVKVLATGHRKPVEIPSGPKMTARKMVKKVLQETAGWRYSVVSIGYPGPVLHGKPVSEPVNLGGGWVGFDFAKAFGHPVRVINDAAMQALGSYKGGRMLFLGLGTGLGSALITYEDWVGNAALQRLGKKKWRRAVADVITRLQAALEADDVVVGGGNAKLLKTLPKGTRMGSNLNAFAGGYQLWNRSWSRR